MNPLIYVGDLANPRKFGILLMCTNLHKYSIILENEQGVVFLMRVMAF
jgi:hypothetical protein